MREIGISFLRRLFGGGRPVTGREIQSGAAGGAAFGSESVTPPEPPAAPVAPRREPPAACPYCAMLLDPAPEHGRLCPRCRRRIIVRRVAGRLVLLTEEALEVFEAEREREGKKHTWITERDRWLALARGVSAPPNRIARLGAMPPSEAVVEASKNLYLAAAEHAVRTARRDKHWDEVARIRREQAAALFHASGSPIPPSEEVVALHREWSAAALHSLAGSGAQVELVAGGCCTICKRDDGRAFRIVDELWTQRLPHAGCSKGLCQCDWWPVPDAKTGGPRVRRRTAPHAAPAAAPALDSAAAPEPAAEPAPAVELGTAGDVEPEPEAAAEPAPGAAPEG